LKQQLLQQHRRLYQAYLWEGKHYSWDDSDNTAEMHDRVPALQDMDRIREDYEGRIFEDPLYLMQYTIVWEDTKVAGPLQQSPENEAFVSAENEFYLKKVGLLMFLARDSIYAIARSLLSPVCLSVRLSRCLSHGWISQRRLQLGLRNLHHRVVP